MPHQKTGNETSTAARGGGGSGGFLCLGFWEERAVYSKRCWGGAGKQWGERRPSDLLELLTVAQPPCLVCRKPAMQTPNVQALIRRGDRADLKRYKSHENTINHIQSWGRCFLPKHPSGRHQTEALKLGGQCCCFKGWRQRTCSLSQDSRWQWVVSFGSESWLSRKSLFLLGH